MTTLAQLIEDLTALVESGECTGEEPVVFAHQPNYPLACGVSGPVVLEDEEGPNTVRLVWLAETSRPWLDGREMNPYAPQEAWA